ncbi:hypothetical protein AGOR_G00061650 [Albula goreensis]|uniref:Methyl-CpG-binding domain protein 5 n=1 Tax=Albula goreensis TaxID=1534307 RepID=A0A8T3DYQ4_9TELE|nr:hypothetical protein AGOR_G00061650 [Albula goreensis]
MMNVSIPPAIVPLPSNLPLPTVKPGPVSHNAHAQRVQHAASASISPSPVTSPAHVAGPPLGRVEASPQRSRSSSTSSDHGSFVMPSGPQGPCGGMKAPPRSPRSSMGSPRPSLPSSPSTKPDPLHQYKDIPNQLLVGMNNVLSSNQPNSMFPPGSAGSGPQKGHPGLLGMPLNPILNQHNAASYPASSLLTAAAKAQQANQNKPTGGSGSGGNGSNGGNPSLVGSSGGNTDGHSTLNPMFPPNPSMMMTISEGQSGRAALRDKLMAQQRDPLRKRKQPNGGGSNGGAGSGGNGNNMVFNMLKSHIGGPRHPAPGEQLRKGARPGGFPPNTSMAQLLQSMSCQSSHMAVGNVSACMVPGPGQLQFSEGSMQSVQTQQRIQGRGEPHSGGHDSHEPFVGLMNQMQAGPMGNCVSMVPTPLGNPAPGHPNPHPHQLAHHQQHHHLQPQGHPHALGQASMAPAVPNSNEGSCSQAISEPGDSMNCSMSNLQPLSSSQMFQQMGQQQMLQGMQGFQDPHAFPENPFPNNSSSSPMACLFQNFQVSVPESISDPNKQMSTQPGMNSLPESTGMASLLQLRDGRCELQPQPQGLGPHTGPRSSEGLPGGGGESVDAIYRAVVDAASKGMHVEITTTVSGTTQASPVPALSAMSAFTASIGEPINLPHAVNAVIHGHRGPSQEVDPQLQPRPRRPGAGRPRKNLEQGKGTPESGEAHEFFRSPGRGTPRRQWEATEVGSDGHTLWRGDEFLECSTHIRSSPHGERPNSLAPTDSPHEHEPTAPPHPSGEKAFLEEGFRFNNCKRAALNFKERLEQTVERCAHMNGGPPLQLPGRGYGDVLGPPRQDLTAEDQSPSSSTSLEGPLVKDYIHYNGHYNGCAPSPSDTKSLSSEEDLRHPDSPSNDLLHYRPRTFNMGDLWGQIKGFPPWPGKLVSEDQVHNPGMQNNEQDKVEPERLKTLTEDLEALNRATKRNRKGGKLNNHLEAAIHEAMRLDKMSGSVHQMPPRDRQIKAPKPKRRKISR